MKRKNRILCVIFALVLSVFFLSGFAILTPGQALAKTIRYTGGSTSARSSCYALATTVAHLINEKNADIVVTVAESGGTHDNLTKIQKGTFDLGLGCTSLNGMLLAYNGLTRDEYLKYGPWSDMRILCLNHGGTNYMVVVDEGPYKKIKQLKDLDGVRFSAGMRGSSTEFNTRSIFETLGVKPKWVPGGYGDIVAATKDLELAGFAKAQAGIQLDASVLDLQSVRKIKVMGFTDEELDIALKTVPGIRKVTIKKGEIKAFADCPTFSTWGFVGGMAITTAISQEIGYRMIKAVGQDWDQLCKVYGGSCGLELGKTDIETLAAISKNMKVPPLHAGTVQYFKELGYTVPAVLVPPEYVSSK